jgi:hypothetical protein
LTSIITFDIIPDGRLGLNGTLYWQNYLPNWSAIEFLKNYCTYFNLMLYVNEYDRTVLILPYDEFYFDDAADWTERLINSEPIRVTKYDKPARITFLLKHDSNDILSLESDSETTKEFTDPTSGNMSIGVPFALSHFGGAQSIDGLRKQDYMVHILEKEETDEYQENRFQFATRILYYDSIATTLNPFTFEGDTYDTWWYFTTNGLGVNNFISRYEDQFRNMEYSKVMEATFHIPAHELQKFLLIGEGGFRTPIYVDGVFYYLISIRGWSTDKEQATCTLLQINDKSKIELL